MMFSQANLLSTCIQLVCVVNARVNKLAKLKINS